MLMYVHMEARDQLQVSSLLLSSLSFEIGSHQFHISSFWLDWLAVELLDPPVSALPVLGLQAYSTTHRFVVSAKDPNSDLAQPTVYSLSHPPIPWLGS